MTLSRSATSFALAGTFVAIFILCALAQYIFPSNQFSHLWLNLFTPYPVETAEAWTEGIIASLIAGLAMGYIFAWVYNKSLGWKK